MMIVVFIWKKCADPHHCTIFFK